MQSTPGVSAASGVGETEQQPEHSHVRRKRARRAGGAVLRSVGADEPGHIHVERETRWEVRVRRGFVPRLDTPWHTHAGQAVAGPVGEGGRGKHP